MITSFIVDDEKKNRESLAAQLRSYCPEVEIVGQSASVDDAFKNIQTTKPQLVFLDVEMPNGSGFDLLRKFSPVDFKVIFVTAHSNYAIKAIKFSALDYLLKPIDTDDLIKAVKKAVDGNVVNHQVRVNGLIENLHPAGLKKLAVPVKDGFAFLAPEEIIRLQADGTYTHIFTNTEKFTGTKNIKEYEQLLGELNFFRSHNSHLINLNHVKRFTRLDGYFVHMSDSSVAEISRRKKEEFIEMMTRH